MRRPAAAALVLLSAVVVLVIAAGGWAYHRYRAPGPLGADAVVVVDKGIGVRAIADRLAEAGVIADPLLLRFAARLDGSDKAFRAGEYAFPAGVSLRQVVAMLSEGRTVVRRVTIPEGLLSSEVIALITATEGLVGEVGPPPPDGALLPETYHVSYGDSRADLIARMTAAMDRSLAELWARRPPDLPLKTPEEMLILASIVEKETGMAEERPRVAAVFLNRLRKGMPLQSDPTVAYGLALGAAPLARPLTFADLATPTPYNTYVIDGLPPGPIANPGRAALEAVLDPSDSDELFFVADGSGGHAFARTLEEHNRNVANWRKIQREARRQRALGSGS
ncbi:MAG: endolytic transglycosylase MltG [Rhodospirillales bacterium]